MEPALQRHRVPVRLGALGGSETRGDERATRWARRLKQALRAARREDPDVVLVGEFLAGLRGAS